jgi:ABC-type glutathione transport system ATPase component
MSAVVAHPDGRLLDLRGLVVAAPDRILLDGVDLYVDAGRVTALIGPSGAGKSLCARCVMGVVDVALGVLEGTLYYPPISGRDWYEGVRGGGARAMQRLFRATEHLRGAFFTYAPQVAGSALNPGRTIGRQLALALARRTEPPSDVGSAICEILDEVELLPRVARALPSELSGGQNQRAALAVAIAPEPALVVADEPETGLDPILRRSVTELLVRVCKGRGSGLLLISHHEDTVERIAQTVVRLAPPKRPAPAASRTAGAVA